MPEPTTIITSKPAPLEVIAPTKHGNRTTEFYFGATVAGGCMSVAVLEGTPVPVRCTALAAAALIAIAYAFVRHSAKRGGAA